MTVFRKITGVAAAAAMLIGVSACGAQSGGSAQSSEPSQEAHLTIWGPSEDIAENGWIPQMEKAFEQAHPNYKITWKNAVVSESDAGKQVKQDPAAAADVYLFANDQLGTLIDAQAIGELGDDAAKQVKDQNDPSMVTSVTGTDGKLYGVPYTGNTWFMYYNKAKFTADDVKSLDAMLQKGKVSFPLGNSWYLPAFYVGAGASIFGANGTAKADGIKLGSNANAVTNYLVKLASNPNFVNDNEGSGLAGLANGTVDVVFSGTWDASAAKKALGANYAAAQPPSFTTDAGSFQLKAFSGSKAIAYNPNSKSPQISAQFATFLGSDQAQKAHFEARSIVPTDTKLASIVSNDPAAQAQISTISHASVLQSTLAGMSQFWDPCAAFGTALVNKQVTAENAAAKTADWQKGYDSLK